MKQLRDSGILIGLMGIATALAACPASLDDRCTDGACIPGGNTGDGGSSDGRDADAPDAVAPDDCNEKADASSPEAKGCIVDSFALFVDGATGDDTNDGTKAKPFKTISAAVAKVPSAGKRRIYVCGEGPYAKHVKITTATNLFGGFACGTWGHDGKKAKVAPTENGFALHVDGVTAGFSISDLEFVAADVAAAKDGTHSIAGFINKSNVKLLRTAFAGGAPAVGTMGAKGKSGDITEVSGGGTSPDGSAAQGATKGDAKVCRCSTSAETTRGGTGGSQSGGGGPGLPNQTPANPNSGAAGTGTTDCSNGGSGRKGADAAAASNASAPAGVGAVGPDGWTGAPGVDATESGMPGQGGGGGGSFNDSNGGGGGGCGGCGGFPGKGGGSGGASIALLVNESTVSVGLSTLTAKTGGQGGAGGSGGAGLSGGAPGAGSCSGGAGGRGGDGGAGTGGAGGLSVGVLFKGSAPTIDADTTASIKIGNPGEKGTGGKPGVNDGPPGIAAKVQDAAALPQ